MLLLKEEKHVEESTNEPSEHHEQQQQQSEHTGIWQTVTKLWGFSRHTVRQESSSVSSHLPVELPLYYRPVSTPEMEVEEKEEQEQGGTGGRSTGEERQPMAEEIKQRQRDAEENGCGQTERHLQMDGEIEGGGGGGGAEEEEEESGRGIKNRAEQPRRLREEEEHRGGEAEPTERTGGGGEKKEEPERGRGFVLATRRNHKDETKSHRPTAEQRAGASWEHGRDRHAWLLLHRPACRPSAGAQRGGRSSCCSLCCSSCWPWRQPSATRWRAARRVRSSWRTTTFW